MAAIGVDRGGRAARGWSGGGIVGDRRDEVATVEHGLQRVADQRVASSHDLQETDPLRGRRQQWCHVDEQPPAGHVHRCERRQLPHGEPQRLHGVGHHLLVTDRHVDVVVPVVALRDGEHRGDRPALDELEVVGDQAPLDVLRAAEVRFDPAAQLRESHDLRVAQHRRLLPADRLVDDLTVTHLVDVRVHQTRHQRLPESDGRLHGDDRAIRRDGVGGEQHAGGVGEDHALHDHGHLDLPMVDAVLQAVGHGPLGEERRPAPADVLEDRLAAHDVQIGVLLARERCRRQVFRRRARSHRVGRVLAELRDLGGDRVRNIGRDDDRLDGPADRGAVRADRVAIAPLQARQPIELLVDRGSLRHDPPEGVRRHAEAGRHPDAFDPGELSQVRALAADNRGL